MNALKEKDVIDEHSKGKRRAYIVRSPTTLRLNLERKLESLDKLLPDLEALHITQKNKPAFRFYDGWTEVKEIYKLSLNASKIYGLGSTERLSSIDRDFFDKYVNQIHKNKVDFQDLLTANSKNSANIIRGIRGEAHKIKLLPLEYSQNITDMLIWDDNIALISLEEPIFGTLITSQPLAGTLKTILQFVWSKI